MAASLGLFLSVMMPMGMPEAYMPRLAAVPYYCKTTFVFRRYAGWHTTTLLWVAESWRLSANCGAHAE